MDLKIIFSVFVVLNMNYVKSDISKRVTQLNGSSSVWLQEGQLRTTGSYAHLHMTYQMKPLERRIRFLKALKSQVGTLGNVRNPKWPKDKVKNEKQKLFFLQTYLNSTIDDMSASMREILTAYNSSHSLHEALADSYIPNPGQIHVMQRETKHREKRQLVAATIGLIGGAILEFFFQSPSPYKIDAIC